MKWGARPSWTVWVGWNHVGFSAPRHCGFLEERLGPSAAALSTHLAQDLEEPPGPVVAASTPEHQGCLIPGTFQVHVRPLRAAGEWILGVSLWLNRQAVRISLLV